MQEAFVLKPGETRTNGMLNIFGDRMSNASRTCPGCSLFAPKGSSHTFQNVGTMPGRILVMVEPAGLDTLSGATAGTQPDPAVVVPIFHKHGLELLGPPL